jgi:hypothetical protein
MYYPPGDPIALAEANLVGRWRHACSLVVGHANIGDVQPPAREAFDRFR